LLTLVAFCAVPALAQLELPRVSPKASVTQAVGLTDVTINYSRPSVRGRTIFGDLVPWGAVWRTGANEATTIELADDVTINGAKLAKGLYSLHTIPGESEWTVIFNSEATQWGSYSYDAARDALRVAVKPRASDHPHEMLTFAFPNVTASSAEVVMAWDRVMVPFTIGVDTNAKVVASANAALDWRIPFQAANWASQNKVEGVDAMKWVDQSIAIQETWSNLSLKARMLAGAGKRAEAVRTGERALAVARALPNPPNTTAFERELAGWK
ncbi:MAG: DUF2911 domain-containing protein, partial [Thermoanaerobaculia bacterium]